MEYAEDSPFFRLLATKYAPDREVEAYIWVRYADAEDEKVLVKQPIAVHVEKVYDEGNFAGPGIGT